MRVNYSWISERRSTALLSSQWLCKRAETDQQTQIFLFYFYISKECVYSPHKTHGWHILLSWVQQAKCWTKYWICEEYSRILIHGPVKEALQVQTESTQDSNRPVAVAQLKVKLNSMCEWLRGTYCLRFLLELLEGLSVLFQRTKPPSPY